jgi:hypothetical protein
MRGAVWVGLAFLAACGGGGGSDGGASSGGGATPSGLVPTAPATGNVLVEQASELRPLRPGATWIYRGAVQAAYQGIVEYTNVVTQASSGSSVTEQSSDALGEGSDSSDVRLVAGSIRTNLSLAELGVAETVDAVLLRSPVRALDQVTHFDRRVSGAISDLDGDGNAEALDLAIYSVVVGQETLDLASRRAVPAVRVDTVSLARARGSRDGTLSEVVRAVKSTWYAQGVGVVKTSVDVPSLNTPAARDLTVEELDFWDGLTEGLGAAPVKSILRPAAQPGPALLGGPAAATAIGDGLLMLTRASPSDASQFSMSRLDASGSALTTVDFQAPGFFGGQAIQLLRLGDEARLVYLHDATTSILGFDESANRTTAGDASLDMGVALANSSGSPFVAAATANSIWILWLRQRDFDLEGPFSADLMMAGFTADGSPVAPPAALVTQVDSRLLASIAVGGGGDRLLVTWRQAESFGGATTTHYVALDATGAVLGRRQIDGDLFFKPRVTAAGAMYLCWVPGYTGPVAAVRLDASYEPVRAVAGPLANEIVSPDWAGFIFGYDSFGCEIDESRIALVGGEVTRRWPWENNSNALASMVDVSLPPASAPALATNAQRIARFESASLLNTTSVVLSERVLTLGANTGGQTAVVMAWRPPPP